MKEGQKVFIVSMDGLPYEIENGKLLKEYPNSNRWKVRFDYSKLFKTENHFIDKFKWYAEIFETKEEALKKGIEKFEKRIKAINQRKEDFIIESHGVLSELNEGEKE